jgi:probable F420-dependent oxidoreductase
VKIRIGFSVGTQGYVENDELGHVAEELEWLGFDSLWMSERVTGPVLDPVVGLAYAAGRTRKLKIGTSVLVLPGRNPVRVAKELASLDQVSGGRLLLAFGLGVADGQEEQVAGVSRKERGPWLDEALPLIRRFWSEDSVTHEGPRFTYREITVRPKPVQSPLEVWLGGSAPSALRRTGRLSDGWLPSNCTVAEAAAGREIVERAADEAGREIDPEHFGASIVYARGEIPPWLVAQTAARRPGVDPKSLIPVGMTGLRALIEQFVQADFSKFVVRPAEKPSNWTAELEELAEAVLPLQTPARAA